MSRVPRFDRFMVSNHIGRDPVLRDNFTVGQRWCWVAGVLAIAADSPIRGHLFLTEKVPADYRAIATVAGVSRRVAAETLRIANDCGLIERDLELDCWKVCDWLKYNPQPKHDRTAAERMRRHRSRKAKEEASYATVTETVTEGIRSEVEEREEKTPPTPPLGKVVEVLETGKFDPMVDGEDMAILSSIQARPNVDPVGAAFVAVEWSHGEGWRTRSRAQTFRHAMRDAEKQREKDKHLPSPRSMTPHRDTCRDCGAAIKHGVRCRECDHRLYERKAGEAA